MPHTWLVNIMNNDTINSILSTCGLSVQPRSSSRTTAKPQAGMQASLGRFGLISKWAEVVVYL